jgi:hypothetical protein
MNVRSLKLAGTATGVLFLVGTAPTVYAQTVDALTFSAQNVLNNARRDYARNQTVTSTFRFTQSMILNSIGFVTTVAERPNDVPTSLSYTLKGGGSVSVNVNSLSAIENGVRWLTLATPVTMNIDDVVTVSTLGQYTPAYNDPFDSDNNRPASYSTLITGFTSTNPSVTVSMPVNPSLSPNNGYTAFSNGNLRISNPGSNVAPEPGTFALALTGGAALIGICIRRRRNAA